MTTVDATDIPTIFVPDPTFVVERAPAPAPGVSTRGLVVVGAVSLAAGFYLHHLMMPSRPRSNPSCCSSCARGGTCKSSR